MTRLSVDQQTLLRLCSLAEPKPKYAFSLSGGAQLMVHLPEAEVVCDVDVDRDQVDLEGGERPGAFRAKLDELGIAVLPADVVDGSAGVLNHFWVAVVAYRSEEDIPGIWVDAYQSQPSAGEVLTDIYSEFFEEGDLGTLTFDDFERLAKPHVMILSLDDLRRYMTEYDSDEDSGALAKEEPEYKLDSPTMVREGRTVELEEEDAPVEELPGQDALDPEVAVEEESEEPAAVAQGLADEELPDSRRSESESNQ